jgi:O-6-methylguanine DNA methyltransferase
MIEILMEETNGKWFGVGYFGEGIVATAVGTSRRQTLQWLMRSLPGTVKSEVVEEGSEFARSTIVMLQEIESGNEKNKRLSIAADYVPEPLSTVLKTAAAIPIGYVTSYGDIAKAAAAEPRAVGRIMARNPLYPIVPCHRVVGADLSLVGYRGSRKPEELRAKLARLSQEVRGWTEEKAVPIDGRELRVYPVEWAVKRAGELLADCSRQRTLFE